ncbi:transposase [Halorhodospira abdelmalekii]|nr:transposase [Halorhodospira abdelmalekii]
MLFSYPRMVSDLLTGFVREDWVSQLDLSTLEKVNASYVTDEVRSRHDDVVWRVRWGEEWLYVYLLLEFQSTIDPYMAVRMSAYVSLLYQDLIRQEKLSQNGSLPPVLPLVLYNGEPRWSAATDVEALIERVPGGLEQYRLSMQYLLLDEGHILEQEASEELKNLVHALFRLEHSRDEQDLIHVLAQVVAWLKAPEQRGLRRAFLTWIRRVYLRRKHVPEPDRKLIDQAQDLEEVHEMLAERVEKWHEHWKQEGHKEGRQEGRQEGRKEGRLEAGGELLLLMLTDKFGSEAVQRYRDRLEGAEETMLRTWSIRLLRAETIDEVFADD